MAASASSNPLHLAAPAQDARSRQLRRLAWLCAALVLAVTSLSAYLRLSKAGLGCTDWPACYAQSQREPQRAASREQDGDFVAARLAHRVSAVLVLGVVVVMLCIGAPAGAGRRSAMALTLALLVLALFLALIGRWSMESRVPALTLGNLLGGFAMLALSVRLALPQRTPVPRPLHRLAVVATVLLVAQVALGGLVSGSFAGLSCSAWSDCLRAAAGADWTSLDPWREPRLGALPPFNADGALPQALHRGLALVVAAVLCATAFLAWRQGWRGSAVLLLALLLAQGVLGLAMVSAGLPLALALLHNIVAALLLAALVRLL
jgi:cytochrome c oxidase assembly protein subunit 15